MRARLGVWYVCVRRMSDSLGLWPGARSTGSRTPVYGSWCCSTCPPSRRTARERDCRGPPEYVLCSPFPSRSLSLFLYYLFLSLRRKHTLYHANTQSYTRIIVKDYLTQRLFSDTTQPSLHFHNKAHHSITHTRSHDLFLSVSVSLPLLRSLSHAQTLRGTTSSRPSW